jgi:DNA-directed RNA polymerase specialized sigma24 family protein
MTATTRRDWRSRASTAAGSDVVAASPVSVFLRSQSDERLAALVRAGHERAFATLAERHRRSLLAAARRLAGDERAEGLLRQALAEALSAIRHGRHVTNVQGRLHQLVRRAAWRAAAGPDADPLAAELASGLDPDVVADRRAAFDALVARVGRLPEAQRGAVVQIAQERCGRERSPRLARVRASVRAAATAVTPWAVASRASVTRERGPVAGRLGQTFAGVGAPGITGALAKATAIVVATGAVATGLASHGNSQRVGVPSGTTRATALEAKRADRSGGPREPGARRSGRFSRGGRASGRGGTIAFAAAGPSRRAGAANRRSREAWQGARARVLAPRERGTGFGGGTPSPAPPGRSNTGAR